MSLCGRGRGEVRASVIRPGRRGEWMDLLYRSFGRARAGCSGEGACDAPVGSVLTERERGASWFLGHG